MTESYRTGFKITFALVLLTTWGYFSFAQDGIAGVALGWLPGLLLGTVVGLLWPFFLLVAFGMILNLLGIT
jgi:hypothetical protein